MTPAMCTQCGSPMVALQNKNKGAYAVCSTPEKHTGTTAKKAAKKAAPNATKPAETPAEKPVETPKKKSIFNGFF